MKFVKSVMPILHNYRRMPTTGFPQCVCVWVSDRDVCYFQSTSRLPAYCYWLSAQHREKGVRERLWMKNEWKWKMNVDGKRGPGYGTEMEEECGGGEGSLGRNLKSFWWRGGVGGGLDNRGVTDSFLVNLIAEVKKILSGFFKNLLSVIAHFLGFFPHLRV